MSGVHIADAPQFIFERTKLPNIKFEKEDYLLRLDLLKKRLQEAGLTHAVLYGDREHFANIEYFSGYDCRFEESLLIVPVDQLPSIVVGNEGYAYSFQIPYEISRLFYQHFSLQGQPRGQSPAHLRDVFAAAGIDSRSRIGVVGYKYFYETAGTDPAQQYDLPVYIMEELRECCPQLCNFTKQITGLPDGIRMTVLTPKEVAYLEYSASKCVNVLLNMLEALRPGIEEQELARCGKADFSPVCMFGLVNFGAEHLSLGLRSPDDRKLAAGEVCGLCYGVRGSLCSRTGVAAYDREHYSESLRPTLESFYQPAWEGLAAWYEAMKAGALSGDVYHAVMRHVGGPDFGITLNPGHNIGMDEWVNSSFYEGSLLPVVSGGCYQSDIIPNSSDPVQNAICEDTVVIADVGFREQIRREYPELYARIQKRQSMMREILGIGIDDSLLPMSNLNGVYFPFLLNPQKIFTKA